MRSYLIVLILSLSFAANAQETWQQKYLVLEAGGNGGLYSINYEQIFKFIWKGDLNFETGISYSPFFGKHILSIPISVNYYYGHIHQFAFGVGQVLIIAPLEDQGGFIRGTFHVGYRYMPENKKLFYQAGYTPFYSYTSNFQFNHWAGIGIGYRLKTKK